jgi:hypothetical protein
LWLVQSNCMLQLSCGCCSLKLDLDCRAASMALSRSPYLRRMGKEPGVPSW